MIISSWEVTMYIIIESKIDLTLSYIFSTLLISVKCKHYDGGPTTS